MQTGRTAPNKSVAQIDTRQDLFVRTWLHHLIKSRIPALAEGYEFLIGDVKDVPSEFYRWIGTVDESLIDVAGLKIGGRVRKVLTARNDDCAEPFLVSPGTIVAGHGERVLGGGCCVARNLLERFIEVCVKTLRAVIVECAKVGHVGI